jgi:hypothetical protein
MYFDEYCSFHITSAIECRAYLQHNLRIKDLESLDKSNCFEMQNEI